MRICMCFVCVHIFAGLSAAIDHWSKRRDRDLVIFERQKIRGKGYAMVSQKGGHGPLLKTPGLKPSPSSPST